MGKKGAKNIHHRRPQSLGGGGGRNCSLVCQKQHESWHRLFSNYTPEVIAEIINETWLDPSYLFIVVKKEV